MFSIPAPILARILARSRSAALFVVLLLASSLWLAGCGADLPELEPVAHPPLEGVEDRAREQIEEARSALASAERRADARELAEAYGSMGEHYQAYKLYEAAAACYRNAALLDPVGLAWPYYSGLVAQEQGNFEAARGHFEKVLELASHNDPARAHLAEALIALGEGEAAGQQLAELSGDGDFAAVAAWGLGRVAASAGDHERAVEQFRRALELQPEAGPVRHALAQSLRRLGLGEEAEAEQAAVKGGDLTFPDPLAERVAELAVGPSTYLKRGNQAMVAGDLEAAEKLFRQGLAGDPEHVELRLNLGLLKARQGDVQAALSEFVSAAEADPTNAQAQHDIGTSRLALGQAEEAVAAFREALELQPGYPSAQFNLASALGALERWSEVEAAVAPVLERDPEHTRAQYLKAMAVHRQGNSSGIGAELRGLVAKEPGNRVFREGWATVLAESRRVDRAAEVLNDGMEIEALSEEDKVILARKGALLLWKHGRQGPAVDLWRRVTEMEPGSSQAFTDLGNAQQLSGQRPEAVASFQRATELDPQNATAWLSETRLRIIMGDFEGAHRRLGEAVMHHPGDAALANTYARLLATAPDPALRDGERAIQMARLAYGVDPSLEHAETVPMALAEAGRFEQAIQFQSGLAQKAQLSGDRAALGRLVRNLKLYESRQPVRISDPN